MFVSLPLLSENPIKENGDPRFNPSWSISHDKSTSQRSVYRSIEYNAEERANERTTVSPYCCILSRTENFTPSFFLSPMLFFSHFSFSRILPRTLTLERFRFAVHSVSWCELCYRMENFLGLLKLHIPKSQVTLIAYFFLWFFTIIHPLIIIVLPKDWNWDWYNPLYKLAWYFFPQ